MKPTTVGRLNQWQFRVTTIYNSGGKAKGRGQASTRVTHRCKRGFGSREIASIAVLLMHQSDQKRLLHTGNRLFGGLVTRPFKGFIGEISKPLQAIAAGYRQVTGMRTYGWRQQVDY